MILHVGGHNDGALTAFDPATGEVKWTWTGDGPAYGSPIIAEIGGTRQVIVFSQKNFVGVNAANGATALERAVRSALDDEFHHAARVRRQHASSCRVRASRSPRTSSRTRAASGSADLAWENPQVSMSFSNAVLVGDAIFSMSPLNSGQFFWADAKTGKTLWLSEPRQGGNAAITRSGDLLFVLKDTGELMVGKATPGVAFTPMKTYTVATSATWAPPVISGNRIFVKDIDTLALWTLN